MTRAKSVVIHHAWLMERDYIDPRRGRIVALGPEGADTGLIQRLINGEGIPFVLRDASKYPLYAGRYIADPDYAEDGPFSERPLIEYGAHLGAMFIDYSTREAEDA